MRHLLIAAVLAAAAPGALAAQQPAPAAPAPEHPLPSVALPAELDRVLRDYERAWRARDAAGLARLFTEDGTVLANGRPPARGRAAVEQAYGEAGGPLYLRAFSYERQGSFAYVLGGFSAEENAPDGGKFVLVLRQGAEGAWRIVADMDNPNQMPRRPAPPPPA